MEGLWTKPAKTIRECWISFAKVTIPSDAPPDQHRAMELAFYGGGLAVFELMNRAAAQSEGLDPTDDEVRSVKAIYDEMRAWGERNLGPRQ